MSNFPDFSSHAYQVIGELGRNREAGRITYLATALNQDKQVVIKEFRFADSGADWSGFKAYQREIEVLRELDHPRIPRYLNSFETSQGFCLVQEYKNAPSLAERCSFNPEDIKQIALSLLEILVYLQHRLPPIIHRDIKPENILVDDQLNAYLVDFGFARIRGAKVAMSSVAAGTPGFMPPEELFNRLLTEASDLYSLGATLICLLTGTRSVDLCNLIDDNYRLNFKKLVPHLSPSFIAWLQKMVASNVKDRFNNAAIALKALKPIPVVGGAIELETLVQAIRAKKLFTTLNVATISIILLGTTSFLIYQKGSSVRHLLKTNTCVACNLQETNLEGADLKGANLVNANLKYASLERANLKSANLIAANLQGVDLGSANLWGAYLESANLEGAELERANLWGADLESANLEGAELKGANLEHANLEYANLEYANLEGANLKNLNLKGANLKGANLKRANLESANLTEAIMPDGTIHQ
ncbi:pentapeptide repeat-containing protein [Coleofasciculus sp. H7-2]|uniref:pentapeptide repeat-containing protein n=1 Tax=Coleofasciculus sp. H7-2 TaxID=3351545 RepID=UPI00367233AA